TTAWRAGLVFPDQYVLEPTWQGAEPQLAQVWLSLYDLSTKGATGLTVTDRQGHIVGDGVLIDQIALRPTEAAAVTPAHALDARFGSSVELVGYDSRQSNDTVAITLYWRDRAPTTEDLTVFVHLIDSTGR